MKSEKTELKPFVGPRASLPSKEWRETILRPHVLSLRPHDGVIGMDSIAFDHLLPPGPHSDEQVAAPSRGVMTEPFN